MNPLFHDDEECEAEDKIEPTAEPSYTIEDVTLGDSVLHGGTWFEVRGFRVHPEAGISVLLDSKWTSFKDGAVVEVQEAP